MRPVRLLTRDTPLLEHETEAAAANTTMVVMMATLATAARNGGWLAVGKVSPRS